MAGLVVSALSFAFGLFFVPILLPGMRVRGAATALKTGLLCGALSVVFGKLLIALLTFVFFLPIVISGPLGGFLVQSFVNALLLVVASRVVDGIDFDRTRTAAWAGLAITALQVLVRASGP